MQHSEPPGISPPFEAFYIDCMFWNASSAKRSIDEVNEWLRLVAADDPRTLELPKPELFDRLQNIIQQAAALSRYFWPTPRKPSPIHSARAKSLRDAFRIAESSPLHNRDLRNGLEHFDEKLDLYLTQNQVGNFVPDYVDYLESKSEVPLHIFKAFYTYPLIFVLLGTRYEMAPLVNEMLSIHTALAECRSNLYRLPKSNDA